MRFEHIRPLDSNHPQIQGEWDVTDYLVFANAPELSCLAEFWEAVVIQMKLLDAGHADLLRSLAKQSESPDPAHAVDAHLEMGEVLLSHEYLTRAMILSLLGGFVEFALLEVHHLTTGKYPERDRNGQSPSAKEVLRAIAAEIGPLVAPLGMSG